MPVEWPDVEALRRYLTGLDRRLSRSVIRGHTDTGSSSLKLPLLLQGDPLRQQIAANRALIAQFIAWRRLHFVESAREQLLVLCAIAQLAGLGLLPRGLLRAWDYDPARYGARWIRPPVPPASILVELERLLQELKLAQLETSASRVTAIARLEWEVCAGPIHPFYDGCGRVARYFSCLLSQWLAVPLPQHASRDDYFRAAEQGPAAFAAYFAEAVQRGGDPTR
jgi:hypothetical protein